MSQRERNQVFISYSHYDKKWLDRLRVALRPYIRQELIEVWDDTQIRPGADWKENIKEALASAKVAVLLVSMDFLASEFIANDELPKLLEASEKEGLTILWIAVSHSAYKRTPIGKRQAANNPDEPLDSLSTSECNRELVRLCEIIMLTANPEDGEKRKQTDNLHRDAHATQKTVQQNAQQLKPDGPDLWYNKGLELDILGRYGEAIICYDKALQIKPDYHNALNYKGNALINLGRYDEAITCFDKALQIKPDYHNALNNKGNALNNLGRYEDAITCFDKASKVKPDYYDAWYGKGTALYNLGRYDEAITCFDKALQIKPDGYEAWDGKGDTLNNLGRYEDAIVSYDKALEIEPDSYSAWYDRGCSYALQGDVEQALENLRRAAELDSVEFRNEI